MSKDDHFSSLYAVGREGKSRVTLFNFLEAVVKCKSRCSLVGMLSGSVLFPAGLAYQQNSYNEEARISLQGELMKLGEV